MFPEHAVKAYAEVDGQVFQVSLLRTSQAAGLKEGGGGQGACMSMCLCILGLSAHSDLPCCHLK